MDKTKEIGKKYQDRVKFISSFIFKSKSVAGSRNFQIINKRTQMPKIFEKDGGRVFFVNISSTKNVVLLMIAHISQIMK